MVVIVCMCALSLGTVSRGGLDTMILKIDH